jgi:hypothetical protein
MYIPKIHKVLCLTYLLLVTTNNVYGMGLRSFVALPVEKMGGVMRLSVEHNQDNDTNTLLTSAAYGLSAKQTLLLGIHYRLSPAGTNRQGDISALYRHNLWQKDSISGTNRFSVLAGATIPTKSSRDFAGQAGFVYTRFYNRHEIDIDALFKLGIDNRPDSGLYDLSWQYRLSPTEHPVWGIANEIYSILELNGRWNEHSNMTHQITAGIQWIHQKIVIEGGIAKDINNEHELRYILSTRFHF